MRSRRLKKEPTELTVFYEPPISKKICNVFTRILPFVPICVVETFANNIQTCHCAFLAYRGMDYECVQEYRDESHDLLILQAEDFWIFSPQFKKILALAIGEQLGTKITMISTSCPCEDWQTWVFMDADSNRWMVTIKGFCLSMLLPFSNTDIRPMVGKRAQELTHDKVALGAYDISQWLSL